MLLPGQPHSSKEEESTPLQLVTVRHLLRHVVTPSRREPLFQFHYYLHRHQRPYRLIKTVSGKRLPVQATHLAETEVKSDRPKIHLMTHVSTGVTTQRQYGMDRLTILEIHLEAQGPEGRRGRRKHHLTIPDWSQEELKQR